MSAEYSFTLGHYLIDNAITFFVSQTAHFVDYQSQILIMTSDLLIELEFFTEVMTLNVNV